MAVYDMPQQAQASADWIKNRGGSILNKNMEQTNIHNHDRIH